LELAWAVVSFFCVFSVYASGAYGAYANGACGFSVYASRNTDALVYPQFHAVSM
jgi:hypothetical protein